jgi:hypothetical protein
LSSRVGSQLWVEVCISGGFNFANSYSIPYE